MKYLIIAIIILAILIITVAVLGFIYCAGQLNKRFDETFIDTEWEKEFEEQEWD